MDKNIHKGHRERIRDRVRNEGLSGFQDYQVLEYALTFVIPYKDVNPLAHELIKKFGSLSAVLEADEEQLIEVKGMGEVSAHYLTSFLRIFNYYEKEKTHKVITIKNPQESYDYVKSFFSGKLKEEIYLVLLSPKGKILKTEKVSEGTIGEAKVTMRLITDTISRNKVNNIIIAHNHPSNVPEPSEEDDKFTKALVTSLTINDSYLLDHIIIGENNDFYSYRMSGKIDKYRDEISSIMANRIVSQPMAPYGVDYDKK